MTYVEQIATLPETQQRAAHALMAHADDQHVADAVHARVPVPIVSFLAGRSVETVHAVTDAVDVTDRALDAQLAPLTRSRTGRHGRLAPMLIRPAELRAIREGTVDLAFRRWTAPRVRVGTRMRTPVGLVEVTALEAVDADAITDDEVRRAGAPSRQALLDLLAVHPERQAYRIGLRYAGPDPRVALRADDRLTGEDRAAIAARLDRLDRHAPAGPWTRTVLELIGRRPAVRAPDLAAELGRETAPFKRDVRKLKELGLTESLEVGYRLSPRGRAYLGGD